MTQFKRIQKKWQLGLIGLALFGAGIHAQAQPAVDKYPSKTVKMVVPLTPGSGADIAGRLVSKSLAELWKQPVNIEKPAQFNAALKQFLDSVQ